MTTLRSISLRVVDIRRSSSILDRGGRGHRRESHNGWTALHLAARCGHAAIVETLIVTGAPIDTKDWCGQTPLHLAAFHGHTAVAEMLRRPRDAAAGSWGAEGPAKRLN